MAGTGLEKVALQTGIKSTESVVKLFFASHIESFKNNLREKYLQKQISDKNLEELLQTYLSTLHKKCNTINTIIFPRQEVPLESIYEPLVLTSTNRHSIEEEDCSKSIDLLIHDTLDKNLLLIDTAGMGKSTVSKYLILRILQNKLHSKIPIFVELRKVDKDERLLDYIVKEMNPYKRKNFTVEMFVMLMEKGKFVFFFDGFDEVSEDKAKRLGKEISELSEIYSTNLTLLTSREQSYIPTLYKQVSCTFEPLKLKQIKALLLKYDAYASIEVGKELIAHENFKTLNHELFNTPLMVNLLYSSFWHNNTIDDNVVTFYNEMFNALFKGHDLTKAGFTREKVSALTYESFKTLFNAFSFIALFEGKASFKNETEVLDTIKKASTLSTIELENNEEFFIDLLNSVPLLTRDGLEYKFMHKTIMEFFAAEFLNYSEKSHALFEKIKKKELMNSFKKCFEFLYEINKSLYIEEVGKDFLVGYIAFCKKPENQKYNNAFKSFMFLLGKSSLDITIYTKRRLDNKSLSRDGYVMIMNSELGSSKGYKVQLACGETSFLYNSGNFFQEILTKKNYRGNSQFEREEVEVLINNLSLNHEYSFFSKDILKIQDSKLLQYLVSKVILAQLLKKRGNLFIDINKCQALLEALDNKLDVLD